MESDRYGDYGAWAWKASVESRFFWWKYREAIDSDIVGYTRRLLAIQETSHWSSSDKRPVITIIARQVPIYHAVIGNDEVQIALRADAAGVRTWVAYHGGPEVEFDAQQPEHHFPGCRVSLRFFGFFPEKESLGACLITPTERYLAVAGWGLGDFIVWKDHLGHIRPVNGYPALSGTQTSLPDADACLSALKFAFEV